MTDPSLFGTAIAYPLAVTPEGRLATTSGTDILWDSVEAVLDTPPGTAALDPAFGVGDQTYESVGTAGRVGRLFAEAIVRSVPGVSAVTVEILGRSAGSGLLTMRVTLTPITTNVPENRIFRAFGLSTSD